jgi:hypothetical protein
MIFGSISKAGSFVRKGVGAPDAPGKRCFSRLAPESREEEGSVGRTADNGFKPRGEDGNPLWESG